MKSLLVCMLAFFVLSSCGNIESDCIPSTSDYTSDLAAWKAEFQKEKAAWEALGIDRYSYTFGKSGGSIPIGPITVFVYPGREPVTVDWRGEKTDVTASDVYSTLKSLRISDIYTWIEEALNNRTEEDHKLTEFVAEYNRTYHYPEVISPRPRDCYVVGGSYFHISAFEDLRGQR